jgi:hypothetical protein
MSAQSVVGWTRRGFLGKLTLAGSSALSNWAAI